MSFCFVDHRLGVSKSSLNGDMSSVPLSDSAGLYYTGYNDGGYGHHDLSQLMPPVLVDENARELDATSKEEVTKKKGDRAEKAATALKNHSEAERRRRERINAHLATLRGMVPCTDKMDKAALLAEVITQVKKLKTNAARISSHCPSVPAAADEVTVELVHQDASSHGFLVKAKLSCEDAADIFADVKNALRPLRLRVVGSEVATLGGRVCFTFLMSPASGGGDVGVVESVQQALQSVIDKANSALEFAPRASLLNKRRRVSTFDSSSSSS